MKKLFLCIIFITLMLSGCSSKSGNLVLKGEVQNNIVASISTVSGKIVQMNKQSGEPVKKGDTIAQIDNTNQKYTVEQLQAVVNMKSARLEELQAGTRPQQIMEAQARVRGAKAQLDILTAGNREEQIEQGKNAVSIAEEALSSIQITYDFVNLQYHNILDLYNAGASSKSELDNAKYKLDTTSKQLSTAKLQLETSKQQLALLQNGAASEAINAARANYDAANAQLDLLKVGASDQALIIAQADLDQSIAQLKQAENNLNNCNIKALADGIIISKNFELGDVVNIGSDIADIAVSKDVYVLCYIPDQYLDKVSYNQSLNVKTSMGVQVGNVNYIALKHEYTPKDLQSNTDSKHKATKIKVALNDNNGLLKSGMSASVEIPLK